MPFWGLGPDFDFFWLKIKIFKMGLSGSTGVQQLANAGYAFAARWLSALFFIIGSKECHHSGSTGVDTGKQQPHTSCQSLATCQPLLCQNRCNCTTCHCNLHYLPLPHCQFVLRASWEAEQAEVLSARHMFVARGGLLADWDHNHH